MLNSKHKQHGAIKADGITLLIGGLALMGLLVYSATSGYEIPFWPAIAVIGVNVVAAGRLAWAVIKAKKNLQHQNRPPE